MIESWKVIQEELFLSGGNLLEGSAYNYEQRLEMLNDEQRKAVFHQDGPCLVNAVPGAGKTMALTMRFIRLIRFGVMPNKILCCTFTKKAAVEMKERIMGDKGGNLPFIGTMHSVFLKMLSDHPKYYNLRKVPVITRYFSRLKYLLDAAKRFGDDIKNIDFRYVFSEISSAKNMLLGPDDYRNHVMAETKETVFPAGPGCSNVWDYYSYYEKQKTEDGVIDFDDMVYETYNMFVTYPDILEKWRDYFDYIMIDEFQDINKAQWEVIKLLAAKKRNLFMVGDGNQSIYGFRGSRPEFLYNIQQEFPGTKILHMSQNYRSSDVIIDAANGIASNTQYFMTKIMGLGNDGSIALYIFDEPVRQANLVARKIEDLIKNNVNPEDIGVIYRTNECAGLMELKLAERQIKFTSNRGDGFFGSKVVRDCVAYLDAAMKSDCESSLSRIINVPNRYLGVKFKEAWADAMLSFEANPKEALLMGYKYDYWESNAKELYYHLQRIRSLSDDCEAAIEYIIDQVGYGDYIAKDGDDTEYSNLDLIKELLFIARGKSVDVFLKSVTNVKKRNDKEGAVSLMTIHGSKGLEFEHVFMISLIDGIIPHRKSLSSSSSIDEERRMFYVGVTRAKRHLYLCSFNNGDSKLSRFVMECGDIPTRRV